MAREEGDQTAVRFGLDVLTLAVLAILITAPVGALAIGLAGPRLLDRQVKGQGSRCSALEPLGVVPVCDGMMSLHCRRGGRRGFSFQQR